MAEDWNDRTRAGGLDIANEGGETQIIKREREGWNHRTMAVAEDWNY